MENVSEITAMLNERLPVKINENDLKSSPRLQELLQKISEKLGKTGNLKKSETKLTRSVEETDTARRKFLNTSIRLSCLNEMILDHELSVLTVPASSHDMAVVGKMRDNLTLAEVGNMIDLGQVEGNQVTTLGLDPADPRLLARPSCHETASQILPLLEDTMFNKCLSILRLIDQDVEGDVGRHQIHAKIIRLSELVNSLVESVEEKADEEREKSEMWESAYFKQIELLVNMIEKLDRLVNAHYIGSKSKSDLILSQYLSVKCRTLVLKMSCLELEILCSTYSKESVVALRLTRTRLTEKITKTRQLLSRLQSTVQQYQAAGPAFNELVVEYSRLQKDIEGKRWALQELTTSSSTTR